MPSPGPQIKDSCCINILLCLGFIDIGKAVEGWPHNERRILFILHRGWTAYIVQSRADDETVIHWGNKPSKNIMHNTFWHAKGSEKCQTESWSISTRYILHCIPTIWTAWVFQSYLLLTRDPCLPGKLTQMYNDTEGRS